MNFKAFDDYCLHFNQTTNYSLLPSSESRLCDACTTSLFTNQSNLKHFVFRLLLKNNNKSSEPSSTRLLLILNHKIVARCFECIVVFEKQKFYSHLVASSCILQQGKIKCYTAQLTLRRLHYQWQHKE